MRRIISVRLHLMSILLFVSAFKDRCLHDLSLQTLNICLRNHVLVVVVLKQGFCANLAKHKGVGRRTERYGCYSCFWSILLDSTVWSMSLGHNGWLVSTHWSIWSIELHVNMFHQLIKVLCFSIEILF